MHCCKAFISTIMILSTLRLFYFISLINAFARISRQTSLDYENIGNFRDFDGDTFLLLKDLCIKLSTSLVYHKDLVKDIVWTGVYYWGVFFQLQKTCFNVKLIEPTVEVKIKNTFSLFIHIPKHFKDCY